MVWRSPINASQAAIARSKFEILSESYAFEELARQDAIAIRKKFN